MLNMRTVQKITFYAKHYMHKVEVWQNFIYVNERNFCDYTSMATILETCWQALKNMCNAYDNN